MPFDTLCMSAAVSEAQALLDSKITKIYQTDKYTVALKFYGPGGTNRLLLSAHPQFGRLQLSSLPTENPAKPPLFCMVLRKHLENARLLQIRQIPDERVCRLDFAAHDEVGEPTRRTLVLEIMGKHSNLLLLDTPSDTIIDAARRYSHNVSRYREVLPGLPYILPPASQLPAWRDCSEEGFAAQMLAGDLSLPPFKLLQNSFCGLSPFLSQELCCRAGLDGLAASEELGAYELERLYQQLQWLERTIAAAAYQPILLKDTKENNTYTDCYPIALSSRPPALQQSFAGFSQALDFFYKNKEQQQTFRTEAARLHKTLAKEQQRLAKKLKLQEADFAETANAESYKNAGDLLTAYLYLLKPGQAEIELPSFYEPDRLLKIKLRPELSPVDNAKRYFHRYNKAKKAEKQIRRQLELNQAELSYVESLLIALNEAENIEELEALAAEMQTAGYLRRSQGPKKAKSAPMLSRPRKYLTSDGFTLLLGRNNRQNDYLTTKLAAKDDLWFHTQKIPGSHVILRHEPNRAFSDTALLEAAALAAYHSQARQSAKVPVDYTEVRSVRKPNGARPGMVIYFEQQTLNVQPRELVPAADEDTD